ncbi:hypothetical protein [Actinomadura sp. WMMB 499]|uniref:hypothetical protein n=1 Tax=Actinomadura sp. WMMB 499 TaxID=1219491 RepID=UPI0012482C83|nr:hypothetical protein [Actinomadura sp. WMMB 499]QFG21556.1 hypothetical protein F7P10_10840 [Actinomadura sp. WMMB 499]
MTEPITSEYDDDPIEVDTEATEGDENAEPPPPPDLGNTDSPDLTVWETRPSFDDPPKDIGEDAGSEPPEASPAAEAFSIDLDSVATQLEAMLSTSRNLVTQYETLRSSVLANQDTIFGQQSVEEDNGTFDFSTGMYWGPDDDEGDPSVWQETAQQFAAQMNPAQQKALQHIGGVLERVGEYIALANHSGQVYAEADRNSKFPPPPGNTVTG